MGMQFSLAVDLNLNKSLPFPKQDFFSLDIPDFGMTTMKGSWSGSCLDAIRNSKDKLREETVTNLCINAVQKIKDEQ